MKVIETELSAEVLALLEASGLAAEDLRAGQPANFRRRSLWGLCRLCGLRVERQVALLRSLAVQPMARDEGVGVQLVAEVKRHISAAGEKGGSFSPPRPRPSSSS